MGANHTMALADMSGTSPPPASPLSRLTTGISAHPVHAATTTQPASAPPRHRAALEFARSLPDVDASRVALWGTSLGAMHVLLIAARRRTFARSSCNAPSWTARNAAPARAGGDAAAGRQLSKMPCAAPRPARRYIPIVGPPGP
ncbi:putative hydrolase [Mycobacterium ulcerans str. Harvey]|uniref:Hydrolase n=1 Tax=Mycobacterium ulcerans str. Harvey TaxID=1299332 RepID=A0ABP3ADL3_MYCUL|nr:putative hydrolase [Mycobacterium ulcerans str. Harvey]